MININENYLLIGWSFYKVALLFFDSFLMKIYFSCAMWGNLMRELVSYIV